jgi:hypothetical protein
MQSWFSREKKINQCDSPYLQAKKENCKIISIDAEKASEKFNIHS